ncbi:MAG TPA: AI-2E family transporter [Candidatus Dormibacteraeota bacterium]|nr:AI-2E family transporter [Candidatus Dormibacteraeota bacterium]
MTAPDLVRAAFAVLAVVALVLVLLRLSELVFVFVIAVVLSEGLRPAVDLLQRRGVHREIAHAVVYIVLIALVVGAIAVLSRPVVAQARSVLISLPRYQADVQHALDQLQLETSVSSAISDAAATVAKAGFSFAANLAHGVVDAVIIVLLSFLWINAAPRLGGFLHGLIPPDRRDLATGMWTQIAAGFAGYVRGVAVNMIVIGLLTGAAAWLLGLPAPALLGVLAGITEMIPLVGPIIGAVPAVLLGFTISPFYPLIVAGVYLVIQQVEAHTLVPLVMRQAVGLPPLVIVLSLATGAAVGGVGGALVAVPVAFATQVVIVRAVAPAIRARYAT